MNESLEVAHSLIVENPQEAWRRITRAYSRSRSVEDAADLLRVDKSTLSRWRKKHFYNKKWPACGRKALDPASLHNELREAFRANSYRMEPTAAALGIGLTTLKRRISFVISSGYPDPRGSEKSLGRPAGSKNRPKQLRT